jgi:nucleotide-binding universal stress UspA family protein
VFGRFRSKLGAPTNVDERLGRALAERKHFLPPERPHWPERMLAVVDGSSETESALLAAGSLAAAFSAKVSVCCVSGEELDGYLESLQGALSFSLPATRVASFDDVAEAARAAGQDLIVASRELSGLRAIARGSELPVLVVPAGAPSATRYPRMVSAVVGLDGSPEAEAVIPFAVRLLEVGTAVRIVLVPDGDSSAEVLGAYAERLAIELRPHGAVEVLVEGSGPSRTIVELSRNADLVVVASHGRGGLLRSDDVPLGSVPERLIGDLACSLLIVPALPSGPTEG